MPIFKRIYDHLVRERCWNIGFITNGLRGVMEGQELRIEPMRHEYKDRWFADPFILDANDNEITLLVEDYEISKKKGRISRLVVDREDYRLKEIEKVIDCAYHLSFPCVVRRGDEIFVMPEALDSEGLTVYKYDEQENKCRPHKTLTSDRLTDAILTEAMGEELLLSTKQPYDSPTLYVYRRNDKDGFSATDEYRFEDRTARNAGNIFAYNNQLYRPAQDCRWWYGQGVVVQQITNEQGKLRFNEVRRLYSTCPMFPDRLHTFNVYDDTIAVDMAANVYPRLSKWLLGLRQALYI